MRSCSRSITCQKLYFAVLAACLVCLGVVYEHLQACCSLGLDIELAAWVSAAALLTCTINRRIAYSQCNKPSSFDCSRATSLHKKQASSSSSASHPSLAGWHNSPFARLRIHPVGSPSSLAFPCSELYQWHTCCCSSMVLNQGNDDRLQAQAARETQRQSRTASLEVLQLTTGRHQHISTFHVINMTTKFLFKIVS